MNKDNTEKREDLIESLAVTMETCFIHHDFAWSELSSLAVRTVEQALSDKCDEYCMMCQHSMDESSTCNHPNCENKGEIYAPPQE